MFIKIIIIAYKKKIILGFEIFKTIIPPVLFINHSFVNLHSSTNNDQIKKEDVDWLCVTFWDYEKCV